MSTFTYNGHSQVTGAAVAIWNLYYARAINLPQNSLSGPYGVVDLNQVSFSFDASKIEGVKDALSTIQPGTYDILSSGPAIANGTWSLAYGNFKVYTQGKLVVDDDLRWTFSGNVVGGRDFINYDAADRGALGEFLTAIGREYVGNNNGFWTGMTGTVPFTASGQYAPNPGVSLTLPQAQSSGGLMEAEGWFLPVDNPSDGASVWDSAPLTLGASFASLPSGVPGLSIAYADPNVQGPSLSYDSTAAGFLAAEAYDPFTVFNQGVFQSPAWTGSSTSAVSFESYESAAQIAGIGSSLTADIGSGGFVSPATYVFTPGQSSNSIFEDSWLTDYEPTYNYTGNGYSDSDLHQYSIDSSSYDWNDFDWGSIEISDYDYGFPVVLDLAGNGLNITPQSSSNVFYDMAGDGYKHRTAWAGAGNGVLVLDLAGTGQITERNQVIFTDWDPTATSDMQALANVFDTNHNGKLDAGDAQFSALRPSRPRTRRRRRRKVQDSSRVRWHVDQHSCFDHREREPA